MNFDKRFVGIPFVPYGRTFQGADCYGILSLYYKENLNIDLPDLRINPDDTKKIFETFLNEISSNWKEIKRPEPNCAVAMATSEKYPKRITHVGIMLDNKRMLHTFKRMGSHVIRIDSPIISTQIRGFYKWQQD